MRVAIVEDEVPARKRLIQLLAKELHDLEVVFEAASVKEAVSQFLMKPSLDLVLMDVQLNDGSSFDIFKEVEVKYPIVFATAYDQYMMEALQKNSIDYLLKPIKQEDLRKALGKYHQLRNHFVHDMRAVVESLSKVNGSYKSRLIVKKGIQFQPIGVDQVAYFLSEHKVTFLVDKNGQRLIMDSPLAGLEETLDPGRFYRINRKFLTSLEAIEGFHSIGQGKLELILKPDPKEKIIVSQERASSFKSWIQGG